MITGEMIEAAWHKAYNAWMKESRHSTKLVADGAAINVLRKAIEAAAQADTPASTVGDGGDIDDLWLANKRMLELYAESYDTMAKDGDGKVNCTAVAHDIRRNMVDGLRKYPARAASPPATSQSEGEPLRAALKPFADEADMWGELVPDDHAPLCLEMGHTDGRYYGSAAKYTVGHLRAARAALASPSSVDWLDVEDRREHILETIAAPDNGTNRQVLSAILECANAWVPEARIIGNVRAGDIARVARAALASPPVAAKEAVDDREAILKRLEMAEKFRDAAILTADESTAEIDRLHAAFQEFVNRVTSVSGKVSYRHVETALSALSRTTEEEV